jgi:2-dehydro-3-deoxyphosphogluconate aldolase/(4S)-4-hydroxy-2-oxoglutarate aldolase
MTAHQLAALGPVIPVIVLQREADAVPLARALLAGGVRVLEVTLRTPVALACMRRIAAEVPEAIVGAGTLRSAADVQAAVAAGCRFGVSPGWSAEVGAACRDSGLPLLPGVATASEVMAASTAGFDFLKFFPATAAGGVPMLRALGGPFPDIAFCPTGGISLETAPQFLALPNVKVCGGSWLTPQDAVDAQDWARITGLARQAGALRRAG